MATGDKKKAVMQFDIDTASLSNDATHVPSSPLVKSALDNITNTGVTTMKVIASYLNSWGGQRTISYTGRVAFLLIVCGDAVEQNGLYYCAATGSTGSVEKIQDGDNLSVVFSNDAFTVTNSAAGTPSIRVLVFVNSNGDLAIT